MGKSNMDIQKSIMKLMRLQTTDMTEKNQWRKTDKDRDLLLIFSLLFF